MCTEGKRRDMILIKCHKKNAKRQALHTLITFTTHNYIHKGRRLLEKTKDGNYQFSNSPHWRIIDWSLLSLFGPAAAALNFNCINFPSNALLIKLLGVIIIQSALELETSPGQSKQVNVFRCTNVYRAHFEVSISVQLDTKWMCTFMKDFAYHLMMTVLFLSNDAAAINIKTHLASTVDAVCGLFFFTRKHCWIIWMTFFFDKSITKKSCLCNFSFA